MTVTFHAINTKQLVVLWTGIIVMVLMLLFPPYLTTGVSHAIQYRSLLSPPDMVSKDATGLMGGMMSMGLTGNVSAPLDSPVLLAELGIAALLTLGLMLTLQERPRIEMHG